jgi:hypothetical protein
VLSLRSLALALVPARSLLVALPLLRLRDLITSVLSEMGRGRPFILKKRAQALHKMCVESWERLQSGVVCTKKQGEPRSAAEPRHHRKVDPRCATEAKDVVLTCVEQLAQMG